MTDPVTTDAVTTWDAARTARFFDQYGEREWMRFEERRDGPETSRDVIRTQVLPEKPDVMPRVPVDEPEVHALFAEFDAALAGDPALRGCGDHIVGVVRIA